MKPKRRQIRGILINGPHTHNALESGRVIEPWEILQAIHDARNLEKKNSPAAAHRMAALQVTFQHPKMRNKLMENQRLFRNVAEICEDFGRSQRYSSAQGPWASLSRNIRNQLPQSRPRILQTNVFKNLDRQGSLGMLISLKDGKTLGHGSGGQLRNLVETGEHHTALGVLPTTTEEATRLRSKPQETLREYDKLLFKQDPMPLDDLQERFANLKLRRGDNGELLVAHKDQVKEERAEQWKPQDHNHQQGVAQRMRLQNQGKQQELPIIQLYRARIQEMATAMETELRIDDNQTIDKMVERFGGDALRIDPGPATVHAVMPKTEAEWNSLAVNLLKGGANLPNQQQFEISYPTGKSFKITLSPNELRDNGPGIVRRLKTPEKILEERMGKKLEELNKATVSRKLKYGTLEEKEAADRTKLQQTRKPPQIEIEDREIQKERELELAAELQRDRAKIQELEQEMHRDQQLGRSGPELTR